MNSTYNIKFCTRLVVVSFGVVLSACGAPVKSATDVASIFSGDAISLESKLSDLCTTLRSRDQEPSLKGSILSPKGCDGAGQAALNLNGLSRLAFLGIDDAATQTDQVIHFGLRVELWLNKSLFDIAGLIGGKLAAKNGQDNKGLLSLPDSLGPAGGPLAFKMNVIDQPVIDKANLHFAMTVNFTATGIVDIDNTIAISAQLIDNKIAAHAKTTANQPFEKSLLKNAEIFVTVIPYANDIYVDAQLDLNVYSPLGAADAAIKSKVEDVASGMLKPAIDSLLNLSPNGGG